MNSRNKGKNGELEFSKWLRDKGYQAIRSQQYCGKAGDADLITNIKNVYLDVKRVEKLNIDKAMEKAIKEANGKIPIIVHRKNRKEWLVTLRAEDYFKGE